MIVPIPANIPYSEFYAPDSGKDLDVEPGGGDGGNVLV
jgi:hypothetical protein